VYYSRIANRKIIVVGGNAAGPGAAAKAKRTDPSAEVLMLEAGNYISTGTCELPYVLSGEIESFNSIVFYTPETFHEEKGVKVFLHKKVTGIDRRNRTIEVLNLSSGVTEDLAYDSLILATGSKARSVNNLLNSYKNVFNLKSVADLVEIQKYISSTKINSVIIIGGGYIGLETAEAMIKLGCEVKVFDINEFSLASADLEISQLVLNEISKNGVEFIGKRKIDKVNSKDYKVNSVKSGQDVFAADLIIVAAGVEPNTGLAVNAGLETGNSGGLKLSNKLKTSDPNIYGAGDNSEVINFITGRPFYFPVATLAHSMGHIAGDNAAGGNSFFNPVVKNIAVKIFDKVFTQVGLSSEEALKSGFNFATVSAVLPNLVKVMPGADKVFGKIIYERSTGFILGAQFFGKKECIGYADMISMMIKQKIKAEELYNTDFNYTPPHSPFINILSVLGRKIRKN